MKKKDWLSITKIVGIVALFMSINAQYDVGVAAGVCLIITKSIKPILLAYKGIDDDKDK